MCCSLLCCVVIYELVYPLIKGKRLDITLPNGQQRSLLVPLTMPIRNLETYICKKENLNPRFHSLQSIDFKHQCFDPGSAVGDIEFSELRLLEKKGNL